MGKCHRRAADDEHIGDHSPAYQSLAEYCERPLKLRPVEENACRFGHAASRSAADR